MGGLKTNKTDGKTDAQRLLHFKFRALDLVEIFVRRLPSSPFLFDVVMPLINAIVECHGDSTKKALAERIGGILTNKICKVKDVAAPPAVSIDEQKELIEELLKAATTAASPVHCGFASAGMQLVVRSLLSSSGHQLKAGTKLVEKTYKSAFSDYIKRRNCRLTPRLFTDLIDRHPATAANALVAEFISAGASARSEYLKVESLKLAASVFQKHASAVKEQYEGKKGQQLAAAVTKTGIAVLGAEWSKSQRLREALTLVQQLVRFVSTKLGMKEQCMTLLEGLEELVAKQVAPGVTQVAAGLIKHLKGEENVKAEQKKGKKRSASEQANGSADAGKKKRSASEQANGSADVGKKKRSANEANGSANAGKKGKATNSKKQPKKVA